MNKMEAFERIQISRTSGSFQLHAETILGSGNVEVRMMKNCQILHI